MYSGANFTINLHKQKVAKFLAHQVKLRIVSVSGGEGAKMQKKETLSSCIDILVATPGRLLQHLSKGKLVFKLVNNPHLYE